MLVLAIRARKSRRGDIVVARHDGLEKIKRISDVRPGAVFLTGDNTLHSTDSRDFGWLDSQAVIAKVVWPRFKREPLANHDADSV